MRVIVISKNQKENIEEICLSLKAQVSYPRLFVLDRCTDGSKEMLESYGEHYIEKTEGVGWEAGKVRNLGLGHFGNSGDTMMLDGDRIPSGFSDTLVEKALGAFDITLIGVSKDPRKFMRTESLGVNDMWGKKSNGVYTAGFIIRGEALSRLVDANGGTLFHPVFDGMWGYEDLYMGDLASHLGMTCGVLPTCCWVRGSFDTKVSKEHDTIQHQKRETLVRELHNENRPGSLLTWGR